MKDNWKNKIDIPLDLIIEHNAILDCTEFQDGCDDTQIVYCFTCEQWECHCKHLCDICGNIPKTDKWVHVFCKCANLICFDDICRKKCIECNEYYCRKCMYRYYARRKGQPSRYICKYCSKSCQRCNNLSLTGLNKCKLCETKVCSKCNYSNTVCKVCYQNSVNKVLEKLSNH